MTPADLAALHARCFRTPPPWSAADFATFVADPLAFLLVEGDAGFLLGRAVAGEAELLTLAVAPESRRRGWGAGWWHALSIRRSCGRRNAPFLRSARKILRPSRFTIRPGSVPRAGAAAITRPPRAPASTRW
jgi:hypothetical protein